MFERKMMEMKDPAFKLFGMKIPLPPAADSVNLPVKDVEDDIPCSEKDATFMKIGSEVKKANSDTDEDAEEDSREGKGSKSRQEISGGSTNLEITPEPDDSSKSSSIDEETSKTGASSSDKAQSGTTDANSDEKQTVLKKPDKLLPCPRCKSMETKFCYYNNYNVHQPRHFCKSCQRYWTAGGTMRNVPVGAGRRKNKNSASRYGRCIISDAIQASRMDCYPNAAHNHQALNCNGTVLSFSVDPSKSEPVTSVLDQGKKKFGGNYASRSSIESASIPTEESRNPAQMPLVSNSNGLSPQIPWPYTWSPAIHPGCFTYPGYGYVIPNYFNGTIPNAWSIPWLQNAASSDSVSSTLGKHPREGKGQAMDTPEEQNRTKKGIWAPKTLRIDDPEEAAKSSIWETLGIKCDTISKGGLFKGFQLKDDKKNQLGASSAMAANPAALSRSLNFRECC